MNEEGDIQKKKQKRVKVSNACYYCRKFHQKCSELKPCDRCSKRKIICSQTEPINDPNKPKTRRKRKRKNKNPLDQITEEMHMTKKRKFTHFEPGERLNLPHLTQMNQLIQSGVFGPNINNSLQTRIHSPTTQTNPFSSLTPEKSGSSLLGDPSRQLFFGSFQTENSNLSGTNSTSFLKEEKNKISKPFVYHDSYDSMNNYQMSNNKTPDPLPEIHPQHLKQEDSSNHRENNPLLLEQEELEKLEKTEVYNSYLQSEFMTNYLRKQQDSLEAENRWLKKTLREHKDQYFRLLLSSRSPRDPFLNQSSRGTTFSSVQFQNHPMHRYNPNLPNLNHLKGELSEKYDRLSPEEKK